MVNNLTLNDLILEFAVYNDASIVDIELYWSIYLSKLSLVAFFSFIYSFSISIFELIIDNFSSVKYDNEESSEKSLFFIENCSIIYSNSSFYATNSALCKSLAFRSSLRIAFVSSN